MELLVVRHAIAEPREAFAQTGLEDADRPLTSDGRRKFEKGALGLKRLVGELDLVATSPLERAMQTGKLLDAAFGGRLRVVRLPELAPDAEPAAMVAWLRRNRRRSAVAAVGHEPHLSALVEHLLTGRGAGFVELKKGGACLLDLGTSPEPGRVRLRWLLTPAQLRDLGR